MIRTVQQLRAYLEREGLSPERLSERINVSNMTIRRILKKAPKSKIPAKYHAQLDLLGEKPSFPLGEQDFANLLRNIENEGKQVKDVRAIKPKMDQKLNDPEVGASLSSRAGWLYERARSSQITVRERAMAAGALLYFINPMDLLPDAVPALGYLDDFAVLTLVTGLLAKGMSSALPAICAKTQA